MARTDLREGEVALAFDPAIAEGDARLIFIGTIRSPWRDKAACPHNLREARERGGGGTVIVETPYRQGLAGLDNRTHVVLLYWLDQARRDIILQRPRHAERVSGVFSLRSPVRPNPIGLATPRVLTLDLSTGRIELDAIDCIDGTPLLDIKPYVAVADSVDKSGAP